ITERKQAEEELEELAATDDLTGLFNRRRFYELLTHAMASAKRFGHPLSLLFFDLDNFKSYNDTYGHLEGDAVLKAIEGCAKRLIRQDIDFCCRYGGEEFTVILPETTKEMAFNVAERFRKEVEKLEFYPKTAKDASRPAKITISIGVAEFKNYDTDTFVNKADKAMYEAKKLGKNKVAISE
ncbi:MAG: GGDEF domain-containing protein, partial [Candidatus Brocadiales bacterium]